MSEKLPEERILEALKALREADEGREAGSAIEARLVREFQKRRTRYVSGRVAAWTVPLLAAAAVVLLVHAPRPATVPGTEPAIASPTFAPEPTVAPEPAVAPFKPAPRRRPLRRPEPAREIATEFFPLLDVQPAFDRGVLVRVVVPASTMRDVGLPVSPDHLNDLVEADVLMGQEGLARAIRFVSLEK